MIVTAASQADATRALAPERRDRRRAGRAQHRRGDRARRRDPRAPRSGRGARHPARRSARRRRGRLTPDRSTLGLATVERDDVIGTIGITPTRPETGFGYLEIDRERAVDGVVAGQAVRREAGPRDRRALRASGRFLWNGGHVLRLGAPAARRARRPAPGHRPRRCARSRPAPCAARRRVPDAAVDLDRSRGDGARRARRHDPGDGRLGRRRLVGRAPRAARRSTTPATRIGRRPVVVLEGTGNIVLSDDDTLIATVGVSDLVVVKSGNAILVIRKDQAQDVRKIVDALSGKRARAVPMSRERRASSVSTTSAASPTATSTTRPCGRSAWRSARRAAPGPVVVGRDPRVHSPRLFAALTDGLRVHADVIDIGVVPTPLLYFAAHHLRARGGGDDHRQPQPARGQRLQDDARRPRRCTAPRSRRCATRSSSCSTQPTPRTRSSRCTRATSSAPITTHVRAAAAARRAPVRRSSSTPATARAGRRRSGCTAGSASRSCRCTATSTAVPEPPPRSDAAGEPRRPDRDGEAGGRRARHRARRRRGSDRRGRRAPAGSCGAIS